MKLILAASLTLFLYWIQGKIYWRYWNKNLTVEIKLDSLDCCQGDTNELNEIVTNNKPLPLPHLHVKFSTSKTFVFNNSDNAVVTDYYYRNDIFSVQGRQRVTRSLTFTCSKRGCYIISDLNLISSDLFMRKTLTSKVKNDIIIHVYPPKVNMTPFEIPFKTITGDFIAKRNLIEDPFEFRGIRQYEPYDSMRNINWKSSAKHNCLLVNTFNQTASQEIKFLLNLDTNIYLAIDKLPETAISIASTLADRFLSEGIPVSLETNGLDLFTKERICQKSGSGYNHITAIDRSLARLDLRNDRTDFLSLFDYISAASGDNTYFIIISNYRGEPLMNRYHTLKNNGIGCSMIIPEYINTEVDIQDSDIIKWEV